MRSACKVAFGLLVALILSACAPSATTQAPESASTDTAATSTASPEPSATLEPSLTPTPTLLDLEIVEWYEHAIANLVDPANTDTQVEVLIRNPNDFPVRLIRDGVELRFLNTAGEVVYSNPGAFWYIWEGEWMTPGQTAALSACVCFQTQGLEKREWESLELTAPLEVATDLAYTEDVEFTAEFVLLEEVVHGYSGPGLATTLTNTSDQVLESISTLVFARDASGRYVGMASFGNAVVSFTEDIGIQPGDTASGLEVSEIDYMGNERLIYEVLAIGIIAEGVPTPGAPEGTPVADWQGIPIMPGATNGGEADDGYTFSTQATSEEIVQFYETALTELGYSLTTSGEQSGITYYFYQKGSAQAIVAIVTMGASNLVQLVVTP